MCVCVCVCVHAYMYSIFQHVVNQLLFVVSKNEEHFLEKNVNKNH